MFEVTSKEYEALKNGGGFCLSCHQPATNVSILSRNVKCKSCGQNRVCGLETLRSIDSLIVIDDDNDPRPALIDIDDWSSSNPDWDSEQCKIMVADVERGRIKLAHSKAPDYEHGIREQFWVDRGRELLLLLLGAGLDELVRGFIFVWEVLHK